LLNKLFFYFIKTTKNHKYHIYKETFGMTISETILPIALC